MYQLIFKFVSCDLQKVFKFLKTFQNSPIGWVLFKYAIISIPKNISVGGGGPLSYYCLTIWIFNNINNQIILNNCLTLCRARCWCCSADAVICWSDPSKRSNELNAMPILMLWLRLRGSSDLIQTLEVVVEVGAADVVWMGHWLAELSSTVLEWNLNEILDVGHQGLSAFEVSGVEVVVGLRAPSSGLQKIKWKEI